MVQIHSATHPAARLAHRSDERDEDDAPVPAVDHIAISHHVDEGIERSAAQEVDAATIALRSRGLKILRSLARQKEERSEPHS